MMTFSASLKISADSLVISVTNLNSIDTKVLIWNTFLDYPYINGFSILRNDIPINYIGPHYKRLFNLSASLLLIKANETKHFEYLLHELFNNFDCTDLSDKDIINIQLLNDKFEVYDELKSNMEKTEIFEEARVVYNKINITTDFVFKYFKKKAEYELENVDNELNTIPLCVFGHNSGYIQLGPTSAHILGFPTTSGLSRSQVTTLREITRIIYDNKTKLSTVSNTPLFRRWFGAYTNTKRETVASVLRKLNRGACPSYTVFNSPQGTCKADTYAFIIYNQNYNDNPRQCSGTSHYCHRLFLCPLFWSRPTRGQDSKLGIIIHELTHGYAYTKDHKYGKAACLSLVNQDPAKALENADNYEYYCEELIN